MELPLQERNMPRYPDDLRRAGRLAANAGQEWTKFEKELLKKTFLYIEDRYPNIFNDIHKEEVCQGVVMRLKANDCSVLAKFRGECTLSSYIASQINWAIKDWLKKYSDRLFEMQADPSEGEGNAGPAVQADHVDHADLDDRVIEGEVFKVMASLRDEWRWAFLLRYYYFFGFPPEEIRSLAKKRGVPIKDITELLIKYFEMEETDILSNQVKKKEKVLKSLGRIHQKMRRLYLEERSLAAKASDQNDRKRAEHRSKIDGQRSKLEEKRKEVRQKEKHVITTPYWVIAEILGEESENTVRSFVFYAKKELKEIIGSEQWST